MTSPQFIGSITSQCTDVPFPTRLVRVDNCTVTAEWGSYSGWGCDQDPCCYNTDPERMTWYDSDWTKVDQ